MQVEYIFIQENGLKFFFLLSSSIFPIFFGHANIIILFAKLPVLFTETNWAKRKSIVSV